jgi:hypothetical protein
MAERVDGSLAGREGGGGGLDNLAAAGPCRLRRPNDPGPIYHGTKGNLQAGNLLVPGYASNFEERKATNHSYFTPTLDAARWGAELPERKTRRHRHAISGTL